MTQQEITLFDFLSLAVPLVQIQRIWPKNVEHDRERFRIFFLAFRVKHTLV